ncbi:MAG: sulfur transferase domain-containing protein, partial [Pseudomonadota bacterium]
GFSMTQLEQLNAAAAEHAGRTLAYCRSGTRSAMLWALTQAKFGDNDVSEILEAAASAGYDASPLARQLEALRQNG